MHLTENETLTLIESLETTNACLWETWAYLPKEWENPLLTAMFERSINNNDSMVERLKAAMGIAAE